MKTLYIAIILSIFSGCSTTTQDKVNNADKARETVDNMILDGRHQDAIAYATQMILKYPDDVWFYFARGYCLFTNKQDEKAKHDFVSCIKIDPKNYKGHYGMALYYRSLGHYALSIKKYKTAISLIDDEKVKASTYGALAVVYIDQKKYVKAIVTIKKALQHNDDGSLYYRLGTAYVYLNQLDKAEKIWLTAVNEKQFNQILFEHLTYYYLSNLYFDQKKYDQSKLYINKALDLDPGNSAYLERLQAIKSKLKRQS